MVIYKNIPIFKKYWKYTHLQYTHFFEKMGIFQKTNIPKKKNQCMPTHHPSITHPSIVNIKNSRDQNEDSNCDFQIKNPILEKI